MSYALKHYLQGLASEFGREEAELMLLHVFNRPYSQRLSLFMQAPQLTQDQQRLLVDLVKQRQQGVPLAYILGETYFFNLELYVNRNCLIPRQDTEILVEAALDTLSPLEESKCLDMATGSGAIILALKTELPQLQAFGSDICEKALQVAWKNADRHQLQIDLKISDWGHAYQAEHAGSFDLITANPPYIAYDELHLMNKETAFEPAKALFAAQSGLKPYFQIILDAQYLLKAGGWIIVEHGFRQAEAIQKIFKQHGLVNVHTFNDLNGHPRVTQAQKTE